MIDMDWYGDKVFESLVGKTITKIVIADYELHFHTDSSEVYKLHHIQDCCEHVFLQDIIGDLEDLLDTPIVKSQVNHNEALPALKDSDDCYTWTFYELATIKGSVTFRWYGTSNGYYSEHVTCEIVSKRHYH